MKKKNIGINADDKAFCDLILLGYNKTEAYRKIYNSNGKGVSISVMAGRKLSIPEIKDYIEERKGDAAKYLGKYRPKTVSKAKMELYRGNGEDNRNEELMQAYENVLDALKTTNGEISLSETDKAKYIRELEELKEDCLTPMDKAKIIAQITDLKQLKKEQTETQQQVKYYLPLSENDIPRYIIERIKTDSQFADNIRLALANVGANIAN